jgi:hypothetical protein
MLNNQLGLFPPLIQIMFASSLNPYMVSNKHPEHDSSDLHHFVEARVFWLEVCYISVGASS